MTPTASTLRVLARHDRLDRLSVRIRCPFCDGVHVHVVARGEHQVRRPALCGRGPYVVLLPMAAPELKPPPLMPVDPRPAAGGGTR